MEPLNPKLLNPQVAIPIAEDGLLHDTEPTIRSNDAGRKGCCARCARISSTWWFRTIVIILIVLKASSMSMHHFEPPKMSSEIYKQDSLVIQSIRNASEARARSEAIVEEIVSEWIKSGKRQPIPKQHILGIQTG